MPTNIYPLTPLKKPHSNMVLKGWEGVPDLHATKAFFEGDENTQTPFIHTSWKLNSIIERIKFLFRGEITLSVMGHTQPPVNISVGEYEFNLPDQNINTNQENL